jgi:hypothetical protein
MLHNKRKRAETGPNHGLELTASRCDVKVARQEWS